MRLNELMKLRECCIRWKREGQEGVAYLPRGVWSHPTNQIHFQITHNFGIGSCTFSNLCLAQTVRREKSIYPYACMLHTSDSRLSWVAGERERGRKVRERWGGDKREGRCSAQVLQCRFGMVPPGGKRGGKHTTFPSTSISDLVPLYMYLQLKYQALLFDLHTEF